MALLAWLNERIHFVLDWFGSQYESAAEKISNFYAHLLRYAGYALEWAKDWTLPKIISYWQDAKDRIAALWQTVKDWTNPLIATVYNFFNTKIQAFKDLFKVTTEELSAEDQRLYDKLKIGDEDTRSFLQVWVDNLIDTMLTPFKWVLSFKELLEALVEIFTPENQEKTLIILKDFFGFLFQLITQPLATILAFLHPIFLDLVCHIIAYSLGSEEYELPDPPDWFLGGSGGDDGYLTPGIGDGLYKPLKSIWISGYTYNNPIGHMGIDLGLNSGDSVHSMHAGVIEYIEFSATGYGNQVTVSGGNWWTRYAHLKSINVSKGQPVLGGQKIGEGNSTGNSTGNHLHLEIKYKGSFINPAQVL